ncbi:hypothetical protein V8C35DRAFT_287843 [Trichoderma chlorosporum]
MEGSRHFSGNTVGNNATVNQGNVNITVNGGTSNADKSFLQAISKTDPVHDKKRILLLKGPLLEDSYNWIFGHEEFNNWRCTKKSGVFWIKGDPGKGKTMLLCGIIEEMERSSRTKEGKNRENLSYFFCQATDYRINTAAAVVGGLIKSLLKQHPKLLSHVRQKYGDEPKDQLDGANAWVILCDIFETITGDSGLPNVTCVVDALDECIKDCKHLLSLIIRTSGNVKWLLSSRNEKDVEKGLAQVPQRLVLELKENAEQISTSIDAYIKHHIQEIEALKDDEELQVKTLDVLKSKAQGTFLWVALVVEQLHGTDHWKVEDVLEEVPKDLEDLYGIILDRTEKLGRKGREACQVLLSIITTAKRPLHLQELLVFINSHWKGNETFKSTYKQRDIRDMAKDCGSILSIREDSIYFIHQSAKDYVVEHAGQRIFPILHQHYKMFEASLVAMSNLLEYDIYGLKDPGIHIDDIPFRDIGSDPLASIRYCCVFWVEHLVLGYQYEGFECRKYLTDDGRLHCFLKEKFLCWIESLSLMRFYPQTQIALQKLKDFIGNYCESGKIESETSYATQLQRKREIQGLKQFTNDAYRFVRNNGESVAHWPLQLYFSALTFEQHNSTIRYTFEQIVCQKFGPKPSLISKRHGQSAFRLQSSFRVPGASHRRYKSLVFSPDLLLIFSPDSAFICQMYDTEFTLRLGIWRADSGIMECSFQIGEGDKIAFFANSHNLISISEDGIMKRWSIDSNSCTGEQALNLKSWSPDDKACAEEQALDLESESSDLRFQFTSYRPLWLIPSALETKVIALSPNGDLAASVDKRGYAIVWNTSTARCVCSFRLGRAGCRHAAFSPDSQLLALMQRNGTRILNTRTGAVVHHLDNHNHAERMKIKEGYGLYYEPGSLPDLADEGAKRSLFSPNSKVLVVADLTRQLRLWDTQTWKLLHTIEPSQHGYLAISPDSAILAIGLFDHIELWSIDTGECLAESTTFPSPMAFSPDWRKSSLMASKSKTGVIHTWSVSISQLNPKVNYRRDAFQGVVISPDLNFVASLNRDGINILSSNTGELVNVLNLDRSPYDVPPIFSPDSKLVAHAYKNYGIQVWCAVTGKPVCLLEYQEYGFRVCSKYGFHEYPFSGEISSMAFSNDPKHLIAGTSSGKIYVWRIDSSQLIYEYDFEYPIGIHEKLPLLVAISPESAHIAASCPSRNTWAKGKIWHLHASRNVVIIPSNRLFASFPGNKTRISFSSDSAILAYLMESMVDIFDVSTGACLQNIPLDGTGDIRLISFDAMNGWLFTNSIFYEAITWKCWQASPRLGYSYDYRWRGPQTVESDAWILLDGKRNCYIPANFRPVISPKYDRPAEMVMSDSLLVIENGLREVVIIKFPSQRETRQQKRGAFDAGPSSGGTSGSAGNSHLATNTPIAWNSGSKSPTRKRGTLINSDDDDQSGDLLRDKSNKRREVV